MSPFPTGQAVPGKPCPRAETPSETAQKKAWNINDRISLNSPCENQLFSAPCRLMSPGMSNGGDYDKASSDLCPGLDQ